MILGLDFICLFIFKFQVDSVVRVSKRNTQFCSYNFTYLIHLILLSNVDFLLLVKKENNIINYCAGGFNNSQTCVSRP